jgi:hypothetical protein
MFDEEHFKPAAIVRGGIPTYFLATGLFYSAALSGISFLPPETAQIVYPFRLISICEKISLKKFHLPRPIRSAIRTDIAQMERSSM